MLSSEANALADIPIGNSIRLHIVQTVAAVLFLCAPWMASSFAASVTYTYDEGGRLKQAQYDNGTKTSYGLDAAGNRTSVANTLDATPPNSPTGLVGTGISSTQVNLSWNAATDTTGSTLVGYYVYRNGTQIGSALGTTFTDSGTSGATTYSYTVASYDNAIPANVSVQSSTASVTTPATTLPSVPTGLSATAVSQTQINLSWNASTDPNGPGIGGYRIYRNGALAISTPNLYFYDTELSGFTTYSYTVAAFDSAATPNVSAPTSAITAKTPDTTAPSVPSGVSATGVSVSQINIAWAASSDTGGSGLAGYHVYRNGALIATTSGTTVSDTGLPNSTTYAYTVNTFDAAVPANTSAFSTAVNGTTLSLTDSITMTEGLFSYPPYATLKGFAMGTSSFGSVSPSVLSGGNTLTSFVDTYASGGNTSTVNVSGFSSSPGASWLTSAKAGSVTLLASAAAYSYASGTATWTWTALYGFTGSGSIACALVHH